MLNEEGGMNIHELFNELQCINQFLLEIPKPKIKGA